MDRVGREKFECGWFFRGNVFGVGFFMIFFMCIFSMICLEFKVKILFYWGKVIIFMILWDLVIIVLF